MTTLDEKLAEIQEAQENAHVTFNTAMRWALALITGTAVEIGTTAQPGSPTNRDLYVLGASPTGTDWSGHGGELALYYSDGWGSNGWDFCDVPDGLVLWDDTDTDLRVYHGTSWETVFNGA